MPRNIIDYDVEAGTANECVAEILKSLQNGEASHRWLACLNPHSYATARNNIGFSHALRTADWLVPDGIGILLAGRLLGEPLTERITGFDIFYGLMRELDQIGGSVFFLGGTEKTLRLIEDKISVDFPSVKLVGTYSPPFKDNFNDFDTEQMLSAISKSKADVLWVGMTAPKQEVWIAQNLERLPVAFTGAIGAVFDFYTGQIKRSHPLFQQMGLEWLPRLLQEPRRLWRRTFLSAPLFLAHILRECLTAGLIRKTNRK